MKTILISGGAGFLGSHLCERHLTDGNRVICVDNLYTGNIYNIYKFKKNKSFCFIEHDIENSLYIDETIDEIYNLACPASPPYYQKSPIKTIKTNVIGIINMLDIATRHGAKILQASTSEVYGDPLEHPQKESYRGNVNPIGIRACYDEGKRCAEALCFDYNREFGTKIKVIRIFNTYGPKMDPKDGRVVSNFILQALQNIDITVYGDGKQTRSFCYVDDLIEGMIQIMNTPDDFNGPVNLGNPSEFTVLDLAEKVIQLTGTSSSIIHKNLPQDDPIQRKPDIGLANDVSGWYPKVGLDEGLKQTIKYYQGILKSKQLRT